MEKETISGISDSNIESSDANMEEFLMRIASDASSCISKSDGNLNKIDTKNKDGKQKIPKPPKKVFINLGNDKKEKKKQQNNSEKNDNQKEEPKFVKKQSYFAGYLESSSTTTPESVKGPKISVHSPKTEKFRKALFVPKKSLDPIKSKASVKAKRDYEELLKSMKRAAEQEQNDKRNLFTNKNIINRM